MGRRKVDRDEIKGIKKNKEKLEEKSKKKASAKEQEVKEEKLSAKKEKAKKESKAEVREKEAKSNVKKQQIKNELANIKKNLNQNTEKQPGLEDGIDILNNQKAKEKKEREERIASNASKNIQDPPEYRISKTFIIVTMLIIGVVVICFFELGPIFGINLNKTSTLDETNKVDIITSNDDIYDEYLSELLIYSNHKVSTYNKNLKKTWEYSLVEQFSPSIYIEGKYMAITNNSAGNIYLFENKKEIMNTKVEGKIANLYFDENGNFAVDYSTNEYKKVIGVYNKSGKLLYNTYPSAKSIIALKLINNAENILIVEATSNSFKVGIDIYTIDSNSQENSVQKVATLDNCFAYDLQIIKNDIILLLDNEIVKCNINTGDISKIKTFDSNQMLYVGISNNYYFTVEKELNDSDNYIFNALRMDNTLIGDLQLDISPKLVKNNGLLNYIVYQNRVQVVNKWGVEVKSIEISSNPKDIILFGNKSIALIYTNKVYIINL